MLYSALDDVQRRLPDAVALRQGSDVLSYRELWERSDALASALRASGVREGDRVAILAENGVLPVIAQWAIYKCHGISVYLNEQLKPDGLGQILDDCEPVLILTHPATMADKLPDTQGLPVTTMEDMLSAAPQAMTTSPALAANPDLVASIIYTSGSTGLPKGVCLTHGNLLSVADMAADGYSTTAADSYLMVVPLHYIHGLMILMAMQVRGASIEFMNSFLFPAMVTRKLKESGVSGFSGVPYHFSALMDRGGFLEADLPDLRWVGVTGGTISPERLQEIRRAQPDIEIHISYGQTECSPRITLLSPEKIDTKPTSVGSVPKGLHVEFLDDDGNAVAEGDVGELVVSGPNVMHGYWNDPANTARVIDEKGRLLTGDLAYRDADGDIFIKGRKQAMIKSAGERIFPEELEALLNSHDAIADCAVVGVPDALYGQRVEAHVVLQDAQMAADHAVAESQIKAYCLERVPFARAPRTFHFWSEFPLKANGKTDKQQLIASVADPSPSAD